MTRRISMLIAAAAVAAGAAGAVLYARDSGPTAKPPTGACTDWFVSPAYRREINSVRALVPRMKRAFAAPGLSTAIAADGKLVWSQGCGFADLERRRVVTRMTQFRVGSVSKTLTAATIARLGQQGRLDVDDNIRQYVAGLPGGPAPTLRQLGSHLGGIRHYEADEVINRRHTARWRTASAFSSTTPLSRRREKRSTTRVTASTCWGWRSRGQQTPASHVPSTPHC